MNATIQPINVLPMRAWVIEGKEMLLIRYLESRLIRDLGSGPIKVLARGRIG
jgi:hypothetical protein